MAETAAQSAPPVETTPYARIGGREIVREIVDRFYNMMDSDPAYQELRAIHAEDLGPMRDSLTLFLTAWMGGPRDWFEQKPGVCMMSMHRAMPITQQLSDQWAEAMVRSVEADPGIDRETSDLITAAFRRMCRAMVSIPAA